MTMKKRREFLKRDEGFLNLLESYSKSQYSLEYWLKGTCYTKKDFVWGYKNKLWEQRDEIQNA